MPETHNQADLAKQMPETHNQAEVIYNVPSYPTLHYTTAKDKHRLQLSSSGLNKAFFASVVA